MNIRSTLLATFAITSFALAAGAAENASDRCLEASAKDDPRAAVVECGKALEEDPKNERARQALEQAKAEIARVDPSEHPAKLNQN